MLKRVAQIAKTYGAQGEVIVKVLFDDFENIIKEPVFLYFEGVPVPFFIKSITPRTSNAYIVRFSTVEDLAHAQELVGRELYVEDNDTEAILTSCNFSRLNDFGVLKGFTLKNQEGKVIGKITDIEEYPANICLKCGEVLIPFHEDLIISLSATSHTLTLQIPKGIV